MSRRLAEIRKPAASIFKVVPEDREEITSECLNIIRYHIPKYIFETKLQLSKL
jgi:hypothetical protein